MKFASRSEKRYLKILKSLKEGASWKEITQATPLSNKQLYSMLQRMIDSGFVEKQDKLYKITDPLLEAAFL